MLANNNLELQPLVLRFPEPSRKHRPCFGSMPVQQQNNYRPGIDNNKYYRQHMNRGTHPEIASRNRLKREGPS